MLILDSRHGLLDTPEKDIILVQSSLAVAFGLVLNQILLEVDPLVSFAHGSGGLTVGTALAGADGLTRNNNADPIKTLQRVAVPNLQVRNQMAVQLLAQCCLPCDRDHVGGSGRRSCGCCSGHRYFSLFCCPNLPKPRR